MADLLDLPDEIILHIFSYLPSRFQILSVSLVCQRLKLLVSTGWYWRAYYDRLCSRLCQPLQLDSIKLLQEACMLTEIANKPSHGVLKGAIHSLDCVHILNLDMYGTSSVVAAGCRNSDVYVWRKRPGDLSSTSSSESGGGRSMRGHTMATLKGHAGWVWSVTSDKEHRPQLLCSGSWDHSVRAWDVSNGECLATFRNHHKSAVLSLCMSERDCLVSGCYDKKVRVLDLREPMAVQMEHKEHRKPVLSVAASPNYIYSASEDTTLCVWDRRNNGLLQKLKFSGLVPSIHLSHNMLSVATTTTLSEEEGERKVYEVYLYSCPTGQLEEIQHFDTKHTRPITRVLHASNMITTASKDGTVRLHSALSPPTFQVTLMEQFSETTDLDYHNTMLAVAEGGRTVSLWETY